MSDATGSRITRAQTQPLHFDWELHFTREATSLAGAYWHSRLDGRVMPSRADLNPAAMRNFTQNTGLIEIRHDSAPHVEYFIRRAGSDWEKVFGAMTGRFIHEFLPPEIEMRWRRVFDAVREKRAPVRVTTGIQFQAKTWLTTEMFVAPLGETGEPNMLFLAFTAWSGGGM
jgi:hypothetical protein